MRVDLALAISWAVCTLSAAGCGVAWLILCFESLSLHEQAWQLRKQNMRMEADDRSAVASYKKSVADFCGKTCVFLIQTAILSGAFAALAWKLTT